MSRGDGWSGRLMFRSKRGDTSVDGEMQVVCAINGFHNIAQYAQYNLRNIWGIPILSYSALF